MRTVIRLSLLLLLVALLNPLPARGTTVRLMRLGELVDNADRVFRGVVISAEPDTIVAGGGSIPVTKYRIRVEEPIKGKFDSIKGRHMVELRMLRTEIQDGALRFRRVVVGLPKLDVGETYLLMTTRPSAIGMSTTVGFGQGLFRIHGSSAINGYGQSVRTESLVSNIRAHIARKEGAQ